MHSMLLTQSCIRRQLSINWRHLLADELFCAGKFKAAKYHLHIVLRLMFHFGSWLSYPKNGCCDNQLLRHNSCCSTVVSKFIGRLGNGNKGWNKKSGYRLIFLFLASFSTMSSIMRINKAQFTMVVKPYFIVSHRTIHFESIEFCHHTKEVPTS